MIYGIIILMITQTIPFEQRISKDIMQFKKGFKKGLLLKKLQFWKSLKNKKVV